MVSSTRTSPSLLVFSDDWGRHPSSCQHLIRELLPAHAVAWINTIGTRTPKLDRATLQRAWEKLTQWRISRVHIEATSSIEDSPRQITRQKTHPNLQVHNPRMWPWFTRKIDRRLNRMMLESQLTAIAESLPQPVVALTTLPITADLVGRLPVASWVYYCVDDFREWPGLDGRTLGRMEEDLVEAADEIVVVSDTLKKRMRSLGRRSHLLTHGCDLDFWQHAGHVKTAAGTTARRGTSRDSVPPALPAHPHLAHLEGPIVLFWGVIDRRMDTAFVERLSRSLDRGTIVLVGPSQSPDPELLKLPRVVTRPAVPFAELPQLAAGASVLVMPYADLAVTRAMQPLKLKEYLATGKPTVVRSLPAVREWSDCLDTAETPEEFAARVLERIDDGLPARQQHARLRLDEESWSAKSQQLMSWIESLPKSRKHAARASIPVRGAEEAAV